MRRSVQSEHGAHRPGHRGDPRDAAEAAGRRGGRRCARSAGCTAPSSRTPPPWLKGGELILTTGMGVGDTAGQAARLRAAPGRRGRRRASDSGSASATTRRRKAHDHRGDEARRSRCSRCPTRCRSSRSPRRCSRGSLAEQYDTLQRAVDAEHVLTRAVLEGAGVEGIAESLADVVEGWALLLDLHGLPLAITGERRRARGASASGTSSATSRPEAPPFSLTMVDEGHHVWVQPVGAQGRVEAFLAVGTPEQPQPARPDRRRPRAQPVRDRAREVARGRRGRAPLAGRLLRRAGARRSCRRPRPRAGSRASGSPATRRCSSSRSSRSATAPDPDAARRWRPPTIARGSRAGSSSRRTPTGSTCCCRPSRRARPRRARRRRSATASTPSSAAAPGGTAAAGRCRPVAPRGAVRAQVCRLEGWQHAGFDSSGPTGCC